jgi:hypothetical protein
LFLTPHRLIPHVLGFPFCLCNMVSFDKLALFAFLQRMRSISLGPNLRAFILRCLLLWPRILRKLRKVWSSHFQTSSSDEKKTKGDTGGPSSTETLRKREDCVVVCASRDLGGGGEPSRHSILGSNDAEQSIPLDDVIPRTPSVPPSLSSSHAPSPQGSPRLSATRLTSGSPYGSTSSLRTGNPHHPTWRYGVYHPPIEHSCQLDSSSCNFETIYWVVFTQSFSSIISISSPYLST